MMRNNMKIIFFGLGSIGLRHAHILAEDKSKKLFAYRTFKGKRDYNLPITELTSWKEVAAIRPDVAFITNPTAMHVETATECAKRGMHLFIEKPIDSSLKGLYTLLHLVRKNKLSTYVAYVLRFHPVIKKLKSILEREDCYHVRVLTTSNLSGWRKGRDPKQSYSAQKKLGGGVILDLSHELDYIQYLLGDLKSIKGQYGRRSGLTKDTEDYADFLIETKKGPVNLHIDYLSHMEQRVIQIDFKDKTLVGDLIASTLTTYQKAKLVKKEQFKETIPMCFPAQIKFFFNHLSDQKMMNNLFDASKLFKQIVQFKNK
jgi:predicted dehydrogenase